MLDRWHLNHALRSLVLEVSEDPTAPFRLTGRHVDMELTEHELDWLCSASGPAALVRLRRGRADRPPPITPLPDSVMVDERGRPGS